jgi:hypothetical protein
VTSDLILLTLQAESDREGDLKLPHHHQSKDIRCSASENSTAATLLLSEINESHLPTCHQHNNVHHSHNQHGHKGHAHAHSHHRGSSMSNPPGSNSKHLQSNGTNSNPFAILTNSNNKSQNNAAVQPTVAERCGKEGSSSNGSGSIHKPVYNGTSSSTLSTMSNSSPPPITIKKEQIV